MLIILENKHIPKQTKNQNHNQKTNNQKNNKEQEEWVLLPNAQGFCELSSLLPFLSSFHWYLLNILYESNTMHVLGTFL